MEEAAVWLWTVQLSRGTCRKNGMGGGVGLLGALQDSGQRITRTSETGVTGDRQQCVRWIDGWIASIKCRSNTLILWRQADLWRNED